MFPLKTRLLTLLVGFAIVLLSIGIGQAQTGLIFDVARQGTTSTYTAISRTGSFSYTGTLKSVVESAVYQMNPSGGGSIIFTAGDFDLGTDYFALHGIHDIIFAGQGIDVTILRNFTNAAADTEPFNCHDCDRLTIRDMTVSAGGSVRSTSDTLDFDYGDNNLIERVKITSSRGRAIVFDGKGSSAGGHADNNIIRNCVITGNIPYDGIQFLSSNGNRVEGCTITGVSRHGIYAVKASATATQPNKASNDNIFINNQISNVLGQGISVTGGSRNVVRGNTISNGNASGIYLSTSAPNVCDNNVVEANTATGNRQHGLRIVSAECHYTFVKNNNFTGNGLGAILDHGTGTIYDTGATPTYTRTPTNTNTPTRTNTPTPTNTPTRTPTPSTTTITLIAVKDSYVVASSSSSNYGTSTLLRTDSEPINRSYIAFDVPTYTGTVVSASLRVYSNSSNPVGHRVYRSTSSWNETTITYGNAPGITTLLGTSSAISANSWTEVNVTSRITGAGQYTFVLDSTNSTATSYSSRQGTNPPQLVIVISSGGSAQAASLAVAPRLEIVATQIPVIFTLVPSATPTTTATETATATATLDFTATFTETATFEPTASETATAIATEIPPTEVTAEVTETP